MGRRIRMAAVVIVVGVAGTACSTPGRTSSSASKEGWRASDGAVSTTALASDPPTSLVAEGPTTTIASAPGVPRGEWQDGAAACTDRSVGPWSGPIAGADPIATLRSGVVPPLFDGPDGTPLTINEFPTVDDYDDPSTLEEPALVYDAFVAAGYQESIEARYQEGNHLAAVTLVRFADAPSASDALAAHLEDYCLRARAAQVRPDGAGLTVLRDRGAVRTLFLAGNVEVSVMVCACYGATDEERERLLDDWSRQVFEALTAAGPTAAPV